MKLTPVTFIAALLVIAGAGFFAGRISGNSSDASAGDTVSESGTRAQRQDLSLAAQREIERTRGERNSLRTTEERKARLEEIIRGENALDRNRALLAFIDQLGPDDFAAAVDHFRSLGLTDSRMGEYALLLTAWAKVDPTGALAYAKENTGTDFARNTILSTWAATDPESAIRWANANHDGTGPNPHMAGIIRGIAESDPARATELLAGMPRSTERGQALDGIMTHILRQGADAARSWISSLTDDSLRNGALLRMANSMAIQDPAGTVDFLISNPGEAAQRRMDDVYNRWASQDKEAALGSLATLPQGEIRSNALRGIVSNIASQNPQEAVALMDRYSADVTDRMVHSMIWMSFDSDPAIAASQISRISDEESRDRMYRRALGAWIESDPAAAQSWIQSNPLPDSIQSHFSGQR